jgi:hypothetical protein
MFRRSFFYVLESDRFPHSQYPIFFQGITRLDIFPHRRTQKVCSCRLYPIYAVSHALPSWSLPLEAVSGCIIPHMLSCICG